MTEIRGIWRFSLGIVGALVLAATPAASRVLLPIDADGTPIVFAGGTDGTPASDPTVAGGTCRQDDATTFGVRVEPTGMMLVTMNVAGGARATFIGQALKLVVTQPIAGLEYNPGTYHKLSVDLRETRSFSFTMRRVLSSDRLSLTTERALWIERSNGTIERVLCDDIVPSDPIAAGVTN